MKKTRLGREAGVGQRAQRGLQGERSSLVDEDEDGDKSDTQGGVGGRVEGLRRRHALDDGLRRMEKINRLSHLRAVYLLTVGRLPQFDSAPIVRIPYLKSFGTQQSSRTTSVMSKPENW